MRGKKSKVPQKKEKQYKKQSVPKALREQVWVHNFGEKYKHQCFIPWCTNTVTVFDYHVGHNIPECKGGRMCLENLKPICARCNQSMGSQYTISEWIVLDINKKERRWFFFL